MTDFSRLFFASMISFLSLRKFVFPMVHMLSLFRTLRCYIRVRSFVLAFGDSIQSFVRVSPWRSFDRPAGVDHSLSGVLGCTVVRFAIGVGSAVAGALAVAAIFASALASFQPDRLVSHSPARPFSIIARTGQLGAGMCSLVSPQQGRWHALPCITTTRTLTCAPLYHHNKGAGICSLVSPQPIAQGAFAASSLLNC
jgi:hypothetical protein